MAETQISLPFDQPFDYSNLLQAHGWVDLLPNYYHPENNSFSRIEELSSGKVVLIEISAVKQAGQAFIRVGVNNKGKLAKTDRDEIITAVRRMLRLDEDFSDFYTLCSQHGQPWTDMVTGKGRLLRSPGLFEDVVKAICTTNIQWSGTRRMLKELVDEYGKPYPLKTELKAFPAPESIAHGSFEDFQSRLRLGYRAAYIYDLAVEMSQNMTAFDALREESLDTFEVRKKLLAIKGVGNYAAATILMLLGRYDEIPVDSVFQQFMREKYFQDQEFDLKKALALYDDWGKWKYLAYWVELIG